MSTSFPRVWIYYILYRKAKCVSEWFFIFIFVVLSTTFTKRVLNVCAKFQRIEVNIFSSVQHHYRHLELLWTVRMIIVLFITFRTVLEIRNSFVVSSYYVYHKLYLLRKHQDLVTPVSSRVMINKGSHKILCNFSFIGRFAIIETGNIKRNNLWYSW